MVLAFVLTAAVSGQPQRIQTLRPVPELANAQAANPADAGKSANRSGQQRPARHAKDGAITFQANVGEVLVQANVVDKHGRSADNLPASDFTIYENGVKQTIESFSHEDAPVSVGILVDNSGSMGPRRQQVDQATLNFVRASNPADEDFIVKFNDLYHLVVPFTSSVPAMVQGLGSISPNASTALFDAIIRAVGYMDQHARRAKQVLLVITDGQDDASSHSLEQTLKLLQSQNAPVIYCIGIFGQDMRGSARRDSENVLKKFAEATGGMAYFPKNLKQVNAITEKVAHDIRLQYSLVYHSNQTGPGYRSIRVVVKDPHLKHLTAQTRKGYYFGPVSPRG